MKSFLNPFLEFFYPRLCVCCNSRLVVSEKHICLPCFHSLPRTDHSSTINNKLETFFAGRFPFIHMASFAYFVKEGKMQKIIHEIKYNNNPSLAFYMGQLCGKDILESSLFLDIDIIVPIPLHKKRLRERGYNQSLKIAEGVASKINKPIDAQNLIRKINNPSQTKNSRFERWKNTEGIFEIEDSSFFEEKHVLLIDDVITTGSTLEACAKQILTCKNSTISIFTVSLSI